MRAGEVSTNELAELLSPSLFADERVVVLEAAAEAGKDAVALIADAAADLPPGTMLVVVHSGGGRAKALADQLKKLGAEVHPCAKITKPAERADFVRREFRALQGQGRRRRRSPRCSTRSAPTSANWRPRARSWSPTPAARSTPPRCAAITAARRR